MWKVLDESVFLFGVSWTKIEHLTRSSEEAVGAYLVVEDTSHSLTSRVYHQVSSDILEGSHPFHGDELIGSILQHSTEDISQ